MRPRLLIYMRLEGEKERKEPVDICMRPQVGGRGARRAPGCKSA